MKPGLGQNEVLNAYQDWENSEYPYDEVHVTFKHKINVTRPTLETLMWLFKVTGV